MIKWSEHLPEDRVDLAKILVQKVRQYADKKKERYDLILAKADTFISQNGSDRLNEDQIFKLWF